MAKPDNNVLRLPVSRPQPPDALMDAIEGLGNPFAPAPQLSHWLTETFIVGKGRLVNPAHAHLADANIACLWTNVENRRQMVGIVGTAEVPQAQGGAWKKARHDAQLCEWFGVVPDFLLTFYAPYAAGVTDLVFCALVEHELYHCAQQVDQYGEPRFHRETGQPIYGIRRHDVEEFVGVVARYGVGGAAGQTKELVAAANRAPLIGLADVAGACGTCLRKVA